jgi:hypothetical protein
MSSTTSDLPCDHAVKPSTTLDDPFSYPDVMTMSVTQLKSELNLQQVSIVGNSKHDVETPLPLTPTTKTEHNRGLFISSSVMQ